MKITMIVKMTPARGHFWSALEWQQPSPRWSGPEYLTPPCSSQTCSCTWCCPCAAARQAPCDAKHSNSHYGHCDHHGHLEDVPDLLVGHLEDLHSCADCGKFFTIVPGVQRLSSWATNYLSLMYSWVLYSLMYSWVTLESEEPTSPHRRSILLQWDSDSEPLLAIATFHAGPENRWWWW